MSGGHPGFPALSPDELRAALQAATGTCHPTDSPQAVQAMREHLDRLLDAGGEPREMLLQYVAQAGMAALPAPDANVPFPLRTAAVPRHPCDLLDDDFPA